MKRLVQYATAPLTQRPIYRYVTLTAQNAGHITARQRKERELWLNALFSESYDQATGRLRKGDAMCCQGRAVRPGGHDAVAGLLGGGHFAWKLKDYDTLESLWDEYAPLWEGLGFATDEGVLSHMNDGQETVEGPEGYTLQHVRMTHPEIAMAVLLATYAGAM